jgi:hypothetical protein
MIELIPPAEEVADLLVEMTRAPWPTSEEDRLRYFQPLGLHDLEHRSVPEQDRDARMSRDHRPREILMSDQTPEQTEDDEQGTPAGAEEYGSLTVEDNPDGTVDPAHLAGTANESDEEVVYQPTYSEKDLDD